MADELVDDVKDAADDVVEQIEQVADDVAHLEPVEGASDAAESAGDDIAGVLKNLHDRVEKLEAHTGVNRAADEAQSEAEEVDAGDEGHSGGEAVTEVAPPEETPNAAEAPGSSWKDFLR